MLRLAAIFLFVINISEINAQSTDAAGRHSIDSLPQQISEVANPDSIAFSQRQKLDSLQLSVKTSFDSLKKEYDDVTSKADNAVNKYQQRIDSLNHLKQPVEKLIAKKDSVIKWKNEKLAPIKAKADTLRAKTLGKIKSLKIPSELEEHTRELTSKIDQLDVTLPTERLPDISLKNPSALSLPQVNNPLNTSVPDIGVDLPKGDLPKGASLPELSSVGEAGEQINKVSDAVPTDINKAPEVAEQQISKLDGVKGVNEQLSAADAHKEMLLKKEDPEALKEQTMKQAKEVAIDHFAGKQQQLKEAMEKVAKYKQKYSSVQSLADLPKKKPNEMRGKPLIERIVPGLALQVLRKNEWLVDFNPYAAYRFTSRLNAGIGWNQRVGYDADSKSFTSQFTIYGPRVFTEYKAFKGFSGRLECEWMHSRVPPNLSTVISDPENRRWVFSTMAGLKKEYRFFKNVKGTVFILYNLYDPDRRSPYADRLNMRFGFEFPMKKKAKKKQEDKTQTDKRK